MERFLERRISEDNAIANAFNALFPVFTKKGAKSVLEVCEVVSLFSEPIQPYTKNL